MIVKRNGRKVKFDSERVELAVGKAMLETEKGLDSEVIEKVLSDVLQVHVEAGELTVEEIQDLIEESLVEHGRFDVARRYIVYREERSKKRDSNLILKYPFLDPKIVKEYSEKANPFPQELGQFVYLRTYARPVPAEGRREYWWETVARVCNYSAELEYNRMKNLEPEKKLLLRLRKESSEMFREMFNLRLFPSGRSLWIANTEAARQFPLSNFNCSFITIDTLGKFSEMFKVLMLGTGVGLSVESKYVSKLPQVRSVELIHSDYKPISRGFRNEFTTLNHLGKDAIEIIVGDSKTGR